MSSDLLHEFGIHEDSKGIREERLATQHADDEVDDDDFGAFEEPEIMGEIPKAFAKLSPTRGGLIDVLDITTTAESQSFGGKAQVQAPASLSGDHDVLDQDDWGDFAQQNVLFDADQANSKEAEQEAKGVKLDKMSSSEPGTKKVMQSVLFPTHKPEITNRSPKSAQQPTADKNINDDFDPWEPVSEQRSMKPPTTSNTAVSKSVTRSPVEQTTAVENVVRGPPPTNVPPPSVLLSLTTHCFQNLPAEIRKSATGQGISTGTPESLGRPQTHKIEASLAKARAGARILAGRKVRWKRDLILSQSMKIGQASGKATGMKLTGVDKGESRREDQEAAEALSNWRRHVGSLRSILSTLNSGHSGNSLTLPDASEMMPIRSMKPSEGAVSAQKACFLCGIRRDERVAKIDVDVEDSFGEWWCEHWGHIDCVVFWESLKDLLPQR